MSKIGEIATRIYDNEFDDAPTQLEREFRIEYISGWLEANVGQFNNLTFQSFGTGDSFLQEEEAILTKLYLKYYYNKHARTVLHGQAESDSLNWTRLTEGDTTIVRSSKIDIVREYKQLAKQTAEEIEQLVHSYNYYRAMPLQTAGNDAGVITGSGGCYV